MKTEHIVTGKTVEEAYLKAVEMYASYGDFSHEVINTGKKGFLGFGRVLAEIKVIIDDGKEEKKPEKKAEKKPERKPEAKKPEAKNTEAKNTEVKRAEEQKPQKQSNAQKPQSKQNNQPKGQRQETKKPERRPEETKVPTPEERALKEESINVTAEEKTLAIEFLKSFIANIGIECEVKGDMTLNEKGFVSRLITVEGKDAPSLIGHRGEMLDALQYLANLCLARKSEGDHKEYVKVIIDIENYREKREQALRALAVRMAEKALKYQRNVLLEPMNPYERMIIHSEIQGIEGVSTHSVGYDENRKIVITCENKKKYKK